MSTIRGHLLSGLDLAPKPVELAVEAGRLVSLDPARTVDVPLADVKVGDRLGQVPRFLYLPGHRSVETTEHEAVDALLGARRSRLATVVHALESRSRVAAAATVLLVASVAAGLWWGLPVFARRAALAVPASIEARAGRAAETALNRLLAPSNLSPREQLNVRLELDRLMRAGGFSGEPRLVFRSMGGKYPNAFALPGGVIVVSDELVKLADDDRDEIAAVLAHELSHWQRRHGLQSVFRESTALLLVSGVTGDLSALTTFASSLPFVLLQRGYSREFEAEADRDALALLERAGIPVEALASILQKLEAARPDEGADYTYLSTHPETDERIRLVRNRPAKILPAAAAEQPPEIVRRMAPAYPAELRAAHVSGTVLVEFIIDRRGRVIRPRIVRSSHHDFEPAVLAAIREWEFKPGRKGGRPVATLATQLLEFNADE